MAIKTIKCPGCGAEQAISREEDNTMHCVFCGEQITELPPYEENEGLDDYEEVKEESLPKEGNPVAATFVLTKDEVEKTLTLAGKLKPHTVTTIVETVLIAVLVVMQILSIVFGLMGKGGIKRPDGGTYLMLAVFIALLPAVWILPKRTNRRIVERSTSGNELTVTVYENMADIYIKEDAKSWQLDFDNEPFRFSRQEGIQIVEMEGGRLLAVPERAFTQPELADTMASYLEQAAQRFSNAHPDEAKKWKEKHTKKTKK